MKTTAAHTFEILLVEDNSADVFLFRQALNGADLDFRLRLITDGEAALEFVSRGASDLGSSAPDIAVLDLNLPRFGGMDVLGALRRSQDFSNLPVLILTSSASPAEQQKAGELGVERFLTKPPDLQGYAEVGLAIREILRRYSTPVAG